MTPGLAAVGTREFDGRLAAFRATVTKKYFSRKRPADDLLGQLGLVWMIKIVRDMDQCADLVTHRGHHLRMTVPDIIDPPARKKIEILLARYIHERHPLAFDENHWRAGIGRENILIVSLKDFSFIHVVVRISYPVSRIFVTNDEIRDTRYYFLMICVPIPRSVNISSNNAC